MEPGTKKIIIKTALISTGLFIVSFISYRLWFMRMPARKVPHDPNVLVSPAMGEVISVKPYNAKVLVELKDGVEAGAIQLWTTDVAPSGTIISIKLSLNDVHFQRTPIDSTVVSITHTQGSFNNAIVLANEDSITRYENEHNEILLQASGFKYKVIQIAGFVARRIEDYVSAGQKVLQGDILGVIKMGSQVVIVLPKQINVVVKAGDRLIDGETIIGKLSE
jgi:phosphatidylserine decarboxylase